MNFSTLCIGGHELNMKQLMRGIGLQKCMNYELSKEQKSFLKKETDLFKYEFFVLKTDIFSPVILIFSKDKKFNIRDLYFSKDVDKWYERNDDYTSLYFYYHDLFISSILLPEIHYKGGLGAFYIGIYYY